MQTQNKDIPKNKKRGQGEGTIYQMKSGLWCARLTIGKTPEGKQRRKAFYGKTEDEVRDKMTAAQANKYKGVYIEPSMTVAQWLDVWLDKYKKDSVEKSTYNTICSMVEHHIKPELGGFTISRLSERTIQRFMDSLKNQGLQRGTIMLVYKYLYNALKHAVNEGLRLDNPAKPFTVSSETRLKVLSCEEQERFIEFAYPSCQGKVLIFALVTGLTINEILGMTWGDVDFEDCTLKVNKTKPVTVSLNTDLISTLKDLKKQINSDKRVVRKHYQENNLVFCDYYGRYLQPAAIRRAFKSIMAKLGIYDIDINCLWRTFAAQNGKVGD